MIGRVTYWSVSVLHYAVVAKTQAYLRRNHRDKDARAYSYILDGRSHPSARQRNKLVIPSLRLRGNWFGLVEVQFPGDGGCQASISWVQWMGVRKGDGGENIGEFLGGQGSSVGGPCRRGGCIPSCGVTVGRDDQVGGWDESPGNTKSRWELFQKVVRQGGSPLTRLESSPGYIPSAAAWPCPIREKGASHWLGKTRVLMAAKRANRKKGVDYRGKSVTDGSENMDREIRATVVVRRRSRGSSGWGAKRGNWSRWGSDGRCGGKSREGIIYSRRSWSGVLAFGGLVAAVEDGSMSGVLFGGSSVGGPCRRGGCIPSCGVTVGRDDQVGGWDESPGNTKSRWELFQKVVRQGGSPLTRLESSPGYIPSAAAWPCPIREKGASHWLGKTRVLMAAKRANRKKGVDYRGKSVTDGSENMDREWSRQHNLERIAQSATIGEQHKRINTFIRLITSSYYTDSAEVDSIISLLSSTDVLQKIVKTELLNVFERSSGVVDILTSEDMHLINRVLKFQWFFDGTDKSVLNPDYFLEHIFPRISFSTRQKVLHALFIHLKDEDLAEGFFEAVRGKYVSCFDKLFEPNVYAGKRSGGLSTLVRHLPLDERRALVFDTFLKVYGQSMEDHPSVGSRHAIQLLLPQSRNKLAESRYAKKCEKQSGSTTDWICFMTIDISVPRLKKLLLEAENGHSRSNLIAQLVLTCSINEDTAALADICKLVATRNNITPAHIQQLVKLSVSRDDPLWDISFKDSRHEKQLLVNAAENLGSVLPSGSLLLNKENTVRAVISVEKSIIAWNTGHPQERMSAENFPWLMDRLQEIVLSDQKKHASQVISLLSKDYSARQILFPVFLKTVPNVTVVSYFARQCPDHLSDNMQFCTGDYLKLVLGSLMSICCTAPELRVHHFLEELTQGTVSARKHALRLACHVLNVQDATNLLSKSWQENDSPSIREVLLQLSIKFFVIEPSPVRWQGLTSMIKTITGSDKNVLSLLTEIKHMPLQYRTEFIKLSWTILTDIAQRECKVYSHINKLFNNITPDILTWLSDEFIENLIEMHLFDPKLSSSMFNLCVAYIFSDKTLYSVEESVSVIKIAMHNFVSSWKNEQTEFSSLAARSSLHAFIKCLCIESFDHEPENVLLVLEQLILGLKSCVPIHEVLRVYLYLEFSIIYHSVSCRSDMSVFGRHAGQLVEGLVPTYERGEDRRNRKAVEHHNLRREVVPERYRNASTLRVAGCGTLLYFFFGWLDTCSSFAGGRLGRGVQSVSCIFRERRPVIEFVPCVDLPRAGSPELNSSLTNRNPYPVELEPAGLGDTFDRVDILYPLARSEWFGGRADELLCAGSFPQISWIIVVVDRLGQRHLELGQQRRGLVLRTHGLGVLPRGFFSGPAIAEFGTVFCSSFNVLTSVAIGVVAREECWSLFPTLRKPPLPPGPLELFPAIPSSLFCSVMSLSSSLMDSPVVSGRGMGVTDRESSATGLHMTSLWACSMALRRFCWFLNDSRLLQRPICDLKPHNQL
uniref:Uncharacterized protein n=1 Tax=Timema shepardi TaxID=629360 RepID=A0A7R9B2B3_TIMSH|nr:unnamed protein product [Timema shepardi]